MELVSFQFQTKFNFRDNLEKLKRLILKTSLNSLILAPEVSLTGFCYDRFREASDFSKVAIEELAKLSKDRIFATTFIERRDGEYFNSLKIIRNGEIIYSQDKLKLFPLGDEPIHFRAGSEIEIFEIDGVKISALICFEIRFPTLWERVKGSDIILVPAMWGKARKDNFETLTKALAISNQCYVVASNSSNLDMASSSAIISPFGKRVKDDRASILTQKFQIDEIEKMRRYIDIGI